MCLTCGCMQAHNDHGVADHMTIDDLKRSADHDGINLKDAAKVLKKTLKADRKVHPQEHEGS